MNIEKGEQPKLAQHDSSVLDLAFCMDCTGSMGSYIENARNSIRQIVEEIVASEKSDVHLALVEYRDHPPQEMTYVTQAHDFTSSIKEMKGWLDQCAAVGGGDGPEAVADGLHDALKLSWREKSTKICVLISDAPPHGLSPVGDTMPNGCSCGIDPIQVVQQMGEKGITLYSVGCEPALLSYKDFFTAIAYKTGGQYVPLRNANLLSKVIIGGAQEEISLEKLMEDVQQEVQEQVQKSGGVVDEAFLSNAVHQRLISKGAMTKNLTLNCSSLEAPSSSAMKYSKVTSLAAVRDQFVTEALTFPTYGHLEADVMMRPMAMHTSYASARAPPMISSMSAAPMMSSMSAAPPAPPPAPPMISAMSAAASTSDSYAVESNLINMQQAQRLVQKAINRSNLSSKP